MSARPKIVHLEVGPWPMNCYVVRCAETGAAAIVDPGAEPRRILSAAGRSVVGIVLTHGHPDHVGALDAIREATDAPAFMHPADASVFGIAGTQPLRHGQEISVGLAVIHAVHTPGHTPGMISLRFDRRVISGDTLFVGGPGKTWSPECFATSIRTLRDIVFRWPDDTTFFPGHGPSGTIGAERVAFERFLAADWPSDLHGDVSWATFAERS